MKKQLVRLEAIIDAHERMMKLPDNLKLSVCHICQRYQVSWIGTLHLRTVRACLKRRALAKRAVTKLLVRPVCEDCLLEHVNRLYEEKQCRAGG